MGAFGFETGVCDDCGARVAFLPLSRVMVHASPDQREHFHEGLAWLDAAPDEATGFVCVCGNVGIRGPVETSW
jgi:hypothetical protein